jgi:hypothetical protein
MLHKVKQTSCVFPPSLAIHNRKAAEITDHLLGMQACGSAGAAERADAPACS